MTVAFDSTVATVGGGNPADVPLLVEARGVSKSFGANRVLHGVEVTVRSGRSHALVGRNGAGKSTLVGLLTGLLVPDEGEIRFGGEPAPSIVDRPGWHANVACVYQTSSIVPTLSVAENLFLNMLPESHGLVAWRAMRRKAREVLADWGMDVDASALAGKLTVGERQQVEIARALLLGSRFIVLDEPTAKLEAREIERLFERVHELQRAGVTFLYISHHLHELYELCQDITVLRDGRRVATGTVEDLPEDALVQAMVGEQQLARRSRAPIQAPEEQEVLSVRELTIPGWCRDVTFAIRAGERVGLAGVSGSGTTQVGEALAGLIRQARGEAIVNGRALRWGDVPACQAAGVGYLPEDRHHSGYVPDFGYEENITLPVLGQLRRGGFVDARARRARANDLAEALQVVASSSAQPVRSLSGGNQQKVVMGRALVRNPSLLVLLNPTAGVDVASKEALFASIEALTAAILMITDDLDELRICHRVLVMRSGRITCELSSGWDDDELVTAIEGSENQ